MEMQNPLLDKQKFPIENSDRNPNNEGFVESERVKLFPDQILTELKREPANFNVRRAVCWKKRARVPFLFMAMALKAISNESDTIAITKILCNMLRTVIETTPLDLVAVVYLLSERIVPLDVLINSYYPVQNQVRIAIAEAYEDEVGDIEQYLKELAAKPRLPLSKQENRLTVVKVFKTFQRLTKICGPIEIKKNYIKELLVSSAGCEPLYLIRLLQRMLREPGVKLCLEEQTLLTALGHAALYSASLYSPPATLKLEDAARVVKEVYSVVPNYDKLVRDLLLGGVWKLRETCTITPGIPFKAMMPSKTLGSSSEIFDKFRDRDFICEYMYPGVRSLIHYTEKGHLEVYGSSGQRTTQMDLDFARFAPRLKKPEVRSFILECYLVMYDRGDEDEEEEEEEKEGIKPSEDRMTCCEANDKGTGKVCIYASDILYLNGDALLQEQLCVRRKLLENSFKEEPGVFQFSMTTTASGPTDLQKFSDKALELGCQRLLVKTSTEDATYEPGSDSENWLVMENGYVQYIHPSLDLVPIAAFRDPDMSEDICTFLLACYDSDKDEFQTIGTLGWGVPNAILDERFLSLRSKSIWTPKPNYKYPETMHPAVWFEPTEVWEVLCWGREPFNSQPPEFGAEDAKKGIILLGYPNFVRVLADKNPKQASSPDQAVELYKATKSFDAYRRRSASFNTKFQPF